MHEALGVALRGHGERDVADRILGDDVLCDRADRQCAAMSRPRDRQIARHVAEDSSADPREVHLVGTEVEVQRVDVEVAVERAARAGDVQRRRATRRPA